MGSQSCGALPGAPEPLRGYSTIAAYSTTPSAVDEVPSALSPQLTGLGCITAKLTRANPRRRRRRCVRSFISFADDLSQQGPEGVCGAAPQHRPAGVRPGSDSSASRSSSRHNTRRRCAKRCAVIGNRTARRPRRRRSRDSAKVLGVSPLCAHSPDECLHGQGPDRVG